MGSRFPGAPRRPPCVTLEIKYRWSLWVRFEATHTWFQGSAGNLRRGPSRAPHALQLPCWSPAVLPQCRNMSSAVLLQCQKMSSAVLPQCKRECSKYQPFIRIDSVVFPDTAFFFCFEKASSVGEKLHFPGDMNCMTNLDAEMVSE